MKESRTVGVVVDAHCHLELFDNPDAIVSESKKNGVAAIITSGWSIKSNAIASGLTRIDDVFATIGIGPEETLHSQELMDSLEGMAKANRKIVGIGEIGLDTKAVDKISIEDQVRLFSAQLDIAQRLSIPAVIHSRGMFGECLKTLEEKGIEKAMFHFFGGSEDDAKMAEKHGYLISIPPLDSGRLRRVIKAVDAESLVAETDAPLVGRVPADASRVIEKVSELKGKSFDEIGLRMMQTIKDYFGIIISEGP